jgi:hypothetical protein
LCFATTSRKTSGNFVLNSMICLCNALAARSWISQAFRRNSGTDSGGSKSSSGETKQVDELLHTARIVT